MKTQIDILELTNGLFTLRDFLRWGTSKFNSEKIYFGHGTDNAWDEAVALCLHVLNLPHNVTVQVLDACLTCCEKQEILKLFLRRIEERIPGAYLINEAWFAGLPFFVDQRVLIPRSPFAELIEKRFSPWVDEQNVQRILEIGTGSGCMAIASALAFQNVQVDAVDLSPTALEVAKINVDKHHVEDQVHLIESDVFSAIPDQIYDLIISNPPYVGKKEMMTLPKEYVHEPQIALASGENGLDVVKKILAEASVHLSAHGMLFVEVGNSEVELIEQFPEIPFTWIELERGGGGIFMLDREQLTLINK